MYSYAIAVPSSTCFRFFLRHLDTSCWLPMNCSDMTCSSSRTWAYMLVSIPCPPGNSKGGAGWRSCHHSWFCEVRQVPRSGITVSTKFIFHIISRPIRSVGKEPLFLQAGTNQAPWFPDAAVVIAIVGGYCPTCLAHHTSSVCGENHSRPPCTNCWLPS